MWPIRVKVFPTYQWLMVHSDHGKAMNPSKDPFCVVIFAHRSSIGELATNILRRMNNRSRSPHSLCLLTRQCPRFAGLDQRNFSRICHLLFVFNDMLPRLGNKHWPHIGRVRTVRRGIRRQHYSCRDRGRAHVVNHHVLFSVIVPTNQFSQLRLKKWPRDGCEYINRFLIIRSAYWFWNILCGRSSFSFWRLKKYL